MSNPRRVPRVILHGLGWLVALLTGCADTATAPADDVAAAAPAGWPVPLIEIVERARERFGVPNVSAVELERHPEAVLVDVRTPDEIAVSSVPGARALADDAARAAFLAAPPDGPVLVVCTAGWRSAEFTGHLIRAGVQASNVEGGVCALAAAGVELVDAEGRPTRRIHAFSSDFADCVPAGFEAVVP